MVTKELTVFRFKETDFKVILDDQGDPWWIAKEVCDYLGDSNYHRTLKRLHADEKGVSKVYTPGGMQDAVTINESGLYHLLFTMQPQKREGVEYEHRLKIVKDFRRWVTHEVLPTIRKTGVYDAAGIIDDLKIRIEKLERGGGHLLMRPVPEIGARSMLNMIIRKFVARQARLGFLYSYSDAWNELYFQFKYRYPKADLRARGRCRKKEPLDCATPDELGDLVALATHIFRESE